MAVWLIIPDVAGRNEKGQLGIGDTEIHNGVMSMDTMAEFTVVMAAVGRNHTLLLTDRGSVFACGDNKSGQCGVGNTTAVIHTPCRINFKDDKISKVRRLKLVMKAMLFPASAWLLMA